MQQDLFGDLNDGEYSSPLNPANGKLSPSQQINFNDLFELSINAFYAAMHAEMSELPIRAEIYRYIEKVKKAAGNAENTIEGRTAGKTATARAAAEAAANDRGDPDVLVVLKAAQKVTTEIHRIMGFLRFSPDKNGVYRALCSPDYCILPALSGHFTLRFGDVPWAIIDEKRQICLYKSAEEKAVMIDLEAYLTLSAGSGGGYGEHDGERQGSNSYIGQDSERQGNDRHDAWEELWKLYHRSVNNEGRKNLKLQRQLIPERYQKYLVEFQK